MQNNPFQANVLLIEKPGGWFLLAKCIKTPVEEWHFASKNQLPGSSRTGTLTGNGLIECV